MLIEYRAAVKKSAEIDRAGFIVGQSQRMAKAAKYGLGVELHRGIRPLKKKKRGPKLLLQDADGNVTKDKADEGKAVKEFMAIRGHGRLIPYAELTEEARPRRRGPGPEVLDTDAVAGMIDARRRAAVCPSSKSHGPMS